MGEDSMYHKRRQFLKASAVSGVSYLSGYIKQGRIQDVGTVQYAIINPFTGPFSELGEEQTRGSELAIERINESDEYEFEIEYERYDSQSDPETALTEATNAVANDNAQFVSGCISSDVALAMNAFALDGGVVYTPGAADVAITGDRCNEFVFRFETNTAQIAEMMAQWTFEELGDRIFFQIADYSYGNSVLSEFERRMQELSDSYERVGTTRAEFGATDFEAFITQIEAAADEADALVVGKTGADLVAFLSQAADRGLQEQIPIVTTTASFVPIRAGVGQAATGVFSAVRYTPDLETGDNQEFVEAYEAAFDGTPDNFARVGFDSIRMVANGIREAGSNDPNDVKDALPGLEQQTIFGPNEFRECDGQALNPVWMGELVEGDGDLPDVELLDGLDGEEAIPPCEETGCDR